MKKRILFAISTLLVLGLAIAAFAYSGTNTKNSAPDCCANCCAKSDSCPMKNKDKNASATEKASCCDKDDCCKGDACPMKKGENGANHESCPMMKKDKETATASVEMKNVVVVSDGKDCCAGGGSDCCKGGGSDCCKGKHS